MSVWTMNIKFSSKTSESFSNCRCLGLCKNYYLEDNTSLQSRPAAGLNINEIFMSEIYIVREGRVSINYSVDDGQVEERVTISQRKQYPQTEDRGFAYTFIKRSGWGNVYFLERFLRQRRVTELRGTLISLSVE